MDYEVTIEDPTVFTQPVTLSRRRSDGSASMKGAFVEAVLVNQLNGDFPGPVLAAVAVPVYSADRQRIVIPRGTRVVGSASATLGRD